MRSLKVHKQLNLDFSELSVIQENSGSLKAMAWNVRENLISDIKKQGLNQEALAVLQALILGQRRDISNDLYKDYAAAGAIHILAISGLHIGILLLFLNFILNPLSQLRYGGFIKMLAIILLLWTFAVLTGLSPSVVRAVCMFSFLAIGMQLKRKTSTLNSLFLSLFFLLVYDPFLIFQVGFQLSYLAVLGIILIQPRLYKVIEFKSRIPDYFWKIITVSIAAQIAVLPLSLYYFHQFPGLFPLSNLIILPVLGIIMGLGFLAIFLASLDLLPGFISNSLEFVLNKMNLLVREIAGQEAFVIENIQISLPQTLVLYFIISVFIFMLIKPNFEKLSLLFTGILLFQASILYGKWSNSAQEAIIFHKNKESFIGLKSNDQLTILSDTVFTPPFIHEYVRVKRTGNIRFQSIEPVFKVDTKLILVVDSALAYQRTNIKPDILLLRNNPKLNMDRLLKHFKPVQLIADGSNSAYLIRRWKETAKKRNIPFHITSEKGAFRLE